MPGRYGANTKAKAIRLVREHAGDYPTGWAAITAAAGRLGMSAETVRKWLRQAQAGAGEAAGVTTAESKEVRELKRKIRELGETIGILKAAAGFPARERGPRFRWSAGSQTSTGNGSGSYRSAGRFPCMAFRSPREPAGLAWLRRLAGGRCGMPLSPRSWPGYTSRMIKAAARRGRYTGR